MAANDPGEAAGAPTPGATVATALGLVPVLRWLTRTAPMAPPAMLPTTSPAASMAAAMLRAGRWGKEGAGWLGGGSGVSDGGSGGSGGSTNSGANGSCMREDNPAPER